MSITVDTINLRFNVKPDYNQNLTSTKESLEKTSSGWASFVGKLNIVGFVITNALAIKDRIIQWDDQYVQSFAKMDEAMTDVMKYTDQTKQEVELMNETFSHMTTRTAREELNALAGAAGRLGITARRDIEGFVDAADKINVALGDDLGEGAIDQIGKLTMVSAKTRPRDSTAPCSPPARPSTCSEPTRRPARASSLSSPPPWR